MQKYIVIFFLMCMAASAQEIYTEHFKGGLFFTLNLVNAGSYYDTSGDETPTDYAKAIIDRDTSSAVQLDTIGRLTNYTFDTQVMRLTYQYLADKDLAFFAGVSFSNFSLVTDETFIDTVKDANGNNIYDIYGNPLLDKVKNPFSPEYSLFRADHFSIGSSYLLSAPSVDLVLSGELRVPFGFDPSVVTDTNFAFLSDGAMEFFAGSLARFKFETSEIITAFRYNHRAEELADQLQIHTKFSLTSVKDTKLSAFANFVSPLGSISNADQFRLNKLSIKEAYLDAGVSFTLIVKDKYLFDVGYSIRPIGKNTWNNTNFRLSLAYLLK